MPRHAWVMVCAVLGCLAAQAPALAQSESKQFSLIQPEDVKWRAPLGLGVTITTLHGDPSKPGLFVQRVRFPPNVFDRPHFHHGDRHVTVIQGTWYVGTGKVWDPEKATPLKPGGYMFQPANAVHWDGAKDEEVIVQIVGHGPSGSSLVDATQPFLVRHGP
jgi:quercetin dioxygenase-like cupin family protein